MNGDHDAREQLGELWLLVGFIFFFLFFAASMSLARSRPTCCDAAPTSARGPARFSFRARAFVFHTASELVDPRLFSIVNIIKHQKRGASAGRSRKFNEYAAGDAVKPGVVDNFTKASPPLGP